MVWAVFAIVLSAAGLAWQCMQPFPFLPAVFLFLVALVAGIAGVALGWDVLRDHPRERRPGYVNDRRHR